MMAYGGNNLMNTVMNKVYSTQRSKFKGSGTSSGIAYSFDINQLPVVQLVSGNINHNLSIDMRVAITARNSSGLNFSNVIPMKATGKLVVTNGVLSITQIKVSTHSPIPIDQLVVGVINSQIIPKITALLMGIPVPQLTNLFGSGLSAQLITGKVIPGPALEAAARITGKPGISAANAPTAANIASLNNGSATMALAIGMVSGAAVNELIKALIPPLSHAFNKSASKVGFGAGIKGTIKATTPVLSINNGSGKASTTISFSGLKGGIKVPIKGWTWVPLPAPNTNVVVTHTLSAIGNKGVITLTGVDSIKVSFSWPTVLKPVEALLKGLLNGILSLFKGLISNAVKGRKFDIFQLPNTIPGTNLGATLKFETGGLGYFLSSVRALIRVTI
jgi:hypothetical protein